MDYDEFEVDEDDFEDEEDEESWREDWGDIDLREHDLSQYPPLDWRR